MYNSRISGLGMYVPENIVTNDDLSKIMDTSNEWIIERTGIKERRHIKKGDGNSTASMGIEAAKIADAHNFIMDLPLGYSTNVGERGTSLSGGQKQRLAIARTLITKPKLLIMDEATSALDYETERRVCENLREKCKGLTVFFITHRLSTIRNANRIIMMHNGSICEVGSHNELIDKRGRYFALYRQQEST